MPVEALFTAARRASSGRTWSRGIELVRAEAVEGVEAGADEVVLRVRAPGRTLPPTVYLYPADEEWDCDCGGSQAICDHVVASVIALRQARQQGQQLPRAARPKGELGYRFSLEGARLGLHRFVLGPEGREEPLDGSLAAAASRKALLPTQADLTIDSLLGVSRVRHIPADSVITVLAQLADCRRVWLAERPIRTAPELLLPQAVVTDTRGGFGVTIKPPAGLLEVVVPGYALWRADEHSDPVLRPLGATELTGLRLERLERTMAYGPDRVAELVGEVLPDLRRRLGGRVEICSRKLPAGQPVRRPVRAAVQVCQQGDKLCVWPAVVYGDPPGCRLEGERLVHLSGPLVRRDPRGEQRARSRLLELDLVAGRGVEVTGREAVQLAAKLRGLGDDVIVEGDAHRRRYPEAPLEPRLTAADGRFDVSFELAGDGDGGQLRADGAAVIAAWQQGSGHAPLLGGGWAPLPAGWLEQHGHRVAELLAARGESPELPRHAQPAALLLCDALEHPRPPSFEALAPLVDGFEALPRTSLPRDLNGSLRGYQQAGVDWLCFLRDASLGALLADDMGLGKTLQALCAVTGRTLVVCPRSVVHSWAGESRRFRPSLRVATYHGASRRLDPRADLTLTTYALLRRDSDLLAAEAWDTVVLDEAQAIKNPDSQVARAAYRLRARFRLALSGTPVENRLDELWSLSHFTNPGLLGGREDFRQRYQGPIAGGEPGAAGRLRRQIRPFVLRRLKEQVLPELPPRTEVVLLCELDEEERAVYDAIRQATRREIARRLGQGGSVMAALEALLRLRQAACHTGLLPGRQHDSSAKVEHLMLALEQAVSAGHKALVFSQWTSLLDLVEPHLAPLDPDFVRLDGSTRDRAGAVARFQDPRGCAKVMLISLKAGGTGLNLTAADHVFILDPWWNPATEQQAADRAHRIGQQRPVMIYSLVAKDTVEERILDLQRSKRALAEAALGEADQALSLTRADLLALLE